MIDFSEVIDPAQPSLGWARVQQWTHPVTQQLDEAAELAWSLGQLEWSCPLPVPMSSGPRRAQGPMQFDPKIEVLLGVENALSMVSSSILHHDLQHWPGKPWRLDEGDTTCTQQSFAINEDEVPFFEFTQPECHSQGVPRLGSSLSMSCPSMHYGISQWPSHELPSQTGSWASLRGHRQLTRPDEPDTTSAHPAWIHTLRQNVLIPQADVDPHGDEPGIALVTWYLDHRRHRACYTSRLLWLRDEIQYWEEDLITTWQDLFLQGQHYKVFLVHPEPPRSTLQFHQAHLLIVQNELDECSVLLTTLRDRHPGPKQLAQAAFAMRCWTNANLVLQTFRPDPQVTFGTSWIYRDDHLIQHTPFLLQSGDSVVVHQSLQRPLDEESLLDRHRIRLLEHDLGEEEEDDFHGMQEQLARAILQVGQPADGPLAQLQDFTLDNIMQCIGAQSPTPATSSAALPQALPQAMVNLQTFFHQQAATATTQQDHVVTTWYLNHVTSPTCHRPRIVALGNDPTTWARHIVNAWRDQIEDGFPFRFYVVRPTPPAFERQPAQPHILLVQQPSNQFRSLILSASHVQNHPGQYVRWAAAIPAPIGKESVVHAANAIASCHPLTDHNLCQVWWGSHLLDQPQEVHNGASIVMLVALIQEAPTPQLNTPDEDDVVWLSQRHSTFSTATNIRDLAQEPAPLSEQAVSSSLMQAPDRDSNDQAPPEEDCTVLMAANHEVYLGQELPLLEQEGVARNLDSPNDAPIDDPLGDLDQDLLPDQDIDSVSDIVNAGEPAEPSPPSAPDLTRYASVIYSINAPPVHARLPYGVRNTFYEAAAAAMQVPERAIVLLHSLPHPPTDIESSQVTPMICQMAGELPEGAIHRYILTDVEFHATLPTLTPDVQRTTSLLPRQLTRSQILRINAVHQYCARAERSSTGCLVWHNHQLIPASFRGLIDLFHGDYLRIALPPDGKTAEEYSTREMAAICWTGDTMYAELGSAGRQFLPDYLPQVPPDTSVVYYSLPSTLYDDDTALLQFGNGLMIATKKDRSPTRVPLQDITNQAESAVCSGSSSEVGHEVEASPVTNQRSHDVSQEPHPIPDFERQLQQLLESGIFAQNQLADGTVLVHTWYLDHYRVPNQQVVYLHPDPTRWRQQLLGAWDDLARQDEWALFHVATPWPFNPLQGMQIHILITQTPDLGQSSVLLSVSFPDEAAGFAYKIAVAHTRLATVNTVLNAAQCHDVSTIGSYKCTTVIQDGNAWSPHRFYQLHSGLHLQVQAEREETLHPEHLPSPSVSPTIPFTISEEDDFSLEELPGPAADHQESPSTQGPGDSSKSLTLCLSKLLPSSTTSRSLRPHCSPTSASVQGPRVSPVVLHLDAALPKSSPLKAESQVDLLWFEEANWKTTILDDLKIALHPLPDGFRMPSIAYDSLCQDYADLWNSPHHIEFYMDGSAGDAGAGWSVIVTITNGLEDRFLGCIWGSVELDVHTDAWLGSEEADNIAAEFTAFAHAQLLSHFFHEYTVVLRPDLSLSRTVATGTTTCKAHPKLAKLLRNLQRWMHGHHSIQEVRGHSNHPWNELADALARHATNHAGPPQPPAFPELQRFLREEHDHDWAWMQEMQASFSLCMPPIIEQQGAHFAPSMRHCHVDRFVEPPEQPTQLFLSVATCNVLALESTTELENLKLVGRIGGHRTARLDSQMSHRGLHVVGIQEARSREGRFTSENYLIFASGALVKQAPLYGCEIWIHKTLAITTTPSGAPLRLAEAQQIVLHADPRRLFLSCELPGFSIVLASLHAPCLGKHTAGQAHPLTIIEEWWHETTKIIESSCSGRQLLVLVDANAPLTEKSSPFFGGHHPDKASSAGAFFEDFLETNQLFVPSTFAHLHSGSSATWTHSSGNATRRDYVLATQELFDMVQNTCVLTDYDNAFGHDDHLPVMAQLHGWIHPKDARKQPRLDSDRMLDPHACQQFQDALHTLPLPTWDVDVDSHCSILSAQVFSLARQHFSRNKGVHKKFKLSETTLSLIAFKRQDLDFARSHQIITLPEIKEEIKCLEAMIRPLVAADVRLHYDDLIAKAQASGDIVNPKLMYRLLRRLGGRKTNGTSRPLPALRKDDGNLVQSFQEQQQLWMDQFSATEAGHQISWDALHDLNRRGRLSKPSSIDLSAFPTLWGLQNSVKKLRRGKTPGPDLIPSDLLKAGGDVLLQCLMPLYTKASAHAQEPLTWKGGFLIPLWKGKQHPSSPSGYRSIFLSSYVAKLYHQQIRAHLVACWDDKITGLQFGGRRHHGTDTAHHLLQTHMAWCKQTSVPSVAIFFDLKAAFYTVLRQTLVNALQDTACLEAALCRLGVDKERIHQLLQHAEEENVTEGLSDHLASILKDMLTSTYFEIKGLSAPCHTTRGTRPGDPIADILFNLSMSALVDDFRQQMEQRAEVPWIGQASAVMNFHQAAPVPATGFLDISFVDDTVILIHAPTNEAILPVVQQAVECMTRAAENRGLELSFDIGKTEGLWHMRGRGSRKFKEKMAELGTSLMWSAEERAYFLHLTYDYKHLGTHVQHGHRHCREVSARGNACKSQCGVLTRPFFMKRNISMRAKAAVFRSMCLSKLMYNVHVWVGFKQTDMDRLFNHVKGPLAVILRGKIPAVLKFEMTVHHASGLLRVPAPDDLLHAARLRYLARLCRNCPAVLWNLMQEMYGKEGCWLQQCQASFAWLHQFYPFQLPVKPEADLVHWLTAISLDPSWKGRIRETLQSSVRFRSAEADAWLWKTKIRLQLEAYGTSVAPPKPLPALTWQCDLCQAQFASSRALAMHASRSHGYRTKVRYFAISDTCPACMKCYHSRKRMADHLQANSRCYAVVQACFPPVDEDTVATLAAEDADARSQLVKAGWWASKAFHPPIRTHGPALPPAESEAAAEMFAKWALRPDRGGSAFQQLQGRCIGEDIAPEPDLGVYEGPAFLLQRAGGEQRGDGRLAHGGLATVYAKLHVKAYVFAHFYSGFRRHGDIHDLLDHRILPNGIQVFALSIDLCLERQRGDLLQKANQFWWLSRAKAGQLIAAGGGPPCETFSAARNADNGPEPLRSFHCPFGLPKLTAKQARQTFVGTRLMEFLIEMLLTLGYTGGCGFLEHPQFPTWLADLWPCSVWTWDVMRWLTKLHAFSLVSFDQCIVGADSVKPTSILLLRMPWVRECLLSRGCGGRCPHGKGAHKSLIGLITPSSFHTSRAKVYPPGLNRLLADGILQYISNFDDDHCSQHSLPEDFTDLIGHAFVEKSTVQPDYHGQ